MIRCNNTFWGCKDQIYPVGPRTAGLGIGIKKIIFYIILRGYGVLPPSGVFAGNLNFHS